MNELNFTGVVFFLHPALAHERLILLRETETETETERNRRTGRQAGRQAETDTDRQTDRGIND